jgi:putative ABC transport system substrate-binding protein
MASRGARSGAQTGTHRLVGGVAAIVNHEQPHVSAGLQDLGYVEDRDFQITYRSSNGYQDRLPALAEELVRLNPDVILAAGLDASSLSGT